MTAAQMPALNADAIWLAMNASHLRGGVDWGQALCAQTDPEAFFPEKGGSSKEAREVCGACAIRQACLKYALLADERYGIWGGTSEHERRVLRRTLRTRRVS